MKNDPETNLLLQDVSSVLKEEDPEEYRHLESLKSNCINLNKAFTESDSVYKDQPGVDSLAESLLTKEFSMSEDLPVRASTGRSWVMASFDLFGYLCRLTGRYEELYLFRKELLHKWENAMFMLLTEELCQTIKDNTANELITREAATKKLVRIWERRDNIETEPFAISIISLWRNRRTIIPAFGTMLGTFELMQLSSILSIRWHNFLKNHGRNTEVLQALEEFLFGLSTKQIKQIRNYMTDKKIYSVEDSDIKIIINPETPLCTTFEEDPWHIYQFYQKRDEYARNRVRKGETGPEKTIEEFLMIYLLSEKSYYPEDF